MSSKHSSMLAVLFALGMFLGPRAVFAEGPALAIDCEGEYGGHLQGIAADAEALYWSFTVSLVKTDLKGKRLQHIDVPSHHGDLCVHAGKVFVAVNLGKFNEEPGKADSWIYVYDAADLRLLAKHAVPEVVHGAGGMEQVGGHFFVVGGLPRGHTQNYVYEYDGDFHFVRRHVLESGYTRMGIQTAFHTGAGWWFGCYGGPPVSLQADGDRMRVTQHELDLSLGICRHPDGTLLRGAGQHVPGKRAWTGRMERVELPGPAGSLR